MADLIRTLLASDAGADLREKIDALRQERASRAAATKTARLP